MWIFHINGFMKEVLFATLTLTVYLCNGICRSYVAFLFHYLDQPDSIIQISNEQKSWLASSIGFIGPIGCLSSGTIMDFCGRKRYLMIMFIPFIISWLVVTLAENYTMLLIGMSLQGLGGGMSFCVSTYISEIATRQHRGALLSIMSIAYNMGIVLNNICMYNFTWNVSSIIFLGLSVAFMASAIFILPESPMWLHSKGRKEEAVKALCSLRCAERSQLEEEIQDWDKCDTKAAKLTPVLVLKSIRKAWRQLLTVAVLFVLLQHSGYSIMIAYTLMIFDRLELPYESSKLAVIYSIVGLIGAAGTPYFMQKLGRKKILSLSSFGMGISMVVVGVYEEMFYDKNDKPNAWIIPVAFYFYALVCTVGVYPLGFIIGGEIFPSEIRGTMNGIYGIVVYLYWAFTLKVYPKLMFYFGIKAMIWAFVISSFLICMYAILILPETQGKTLNEVQEQYFKKKKRPKTEQAQA